MQDTEKIKAALEYGATYLGIELGTTRIKAVLIGNDHISLASGSYTWENKLIDNIWTYSLDDIWRGVRGCYSDLAADVQSRYGVTLKTFGAMGFSGMMHGYMVFDKDSRLLVPFRTWRNTVTSVASSKLTGLFGHNIPQRWCIAHLYQAMLNSEAHVPQISYMTTLAGYIHWHLTGRKAVGIGEASGMFPIDAATGKYAARMLVQFNQLAAEKRYNWKLEDILPGVLSAGENAGMITEEGARLLDPTGTLQAGIPVCPAEGDAGTGMVATNSVAKRTGNVSAGTSVFAMSVLEKELSKVYPEIDLVTTPSGNPVAMVHCNNCTSDINAWVDLFGEFAESSGVKTDKDFLYNLLYSKALEGDDDCGGMIAYNYCSGEPITGFDEGRPIFIRLPDSRLTLANFMRTHLLTALGALKIGMNILFESEGVKIDIITGHGGFFKVPGVGQQIMAAAMGTPVTVMNTAGEGGSWGMAVLAAYMQNKQPGETLEHYLNKKVFAENIGVTMHPDAKNVAGFEAFMRRYIKGLPVEHVAVESI